MKVIKEVFLVEFGDGSFCCAQNTSTPKLYASEKTAKNAKEYLQTYSSGNIATDNVTVKKAYLVLGDEDDSQQKMF